MKKEKKIMLGIFGTFFLLVLSIQALAALTIGGLIIYACATEKGKRRN